MRELFVAGNWKMNLNGQQSVELAKALKHEFGGLDEVRLAVCPPFVYLSSVAEVLSGSAIGVGAQNMYPESEGAFTGEVAGLMLLDVGCRYVILGHSERRHVIGETDDFVNAKVLKALDVGLEPILCVGETLEEREAERTVAVVSGQLRAGLEGVSAEQMSRVTIAYEPVWAIGTGRNATPEQAEEVHVTLRALLGEVYDGEVAEAAIIQYGGSVKPENAAELMGMPNVDGALVGGASLKADAFGGIIRAACDAQG
ncbi:MAG: triosephosphate isomerase [Planctomycetes bacterium SM23_32]|nr:MAG: triosephosphate isomerase [Planctomycetes bacterium SM23_32]